MLYPLTIHTTRTIKKPSLSLDKVFLMDPTKTTTLRKQFSAAMDKRFRKIKALVLESVYKNDCFGLSKTSPKLSIHQAALPGQFAFQRDPEKVSQFMLWLQEQIDRELLYKSTRFRSIGPAVEESWMNVFIESAYQRGLSNAWEELRKNGVEVPEAFSAGSTPMAIAFNQPIHVDTMGLAFTRSYNDLKGITDEMGMQISRTLAQGLADGRGPMEIARLLNQVIELPRVPVSIPGVGVRNLTSIQRARMLARTEVIRAHHLANINEYENAGIYEIKLQAEWLTAGDGKVCERCRILSRKDNGMGPGVYTLDQIRGMIPAHPNCRCMAKPYKKEWYD